MRRANTAEALLDDFEHHVANIGPADPGIRDGAPGEHLAVVGVEDKGAPECEGGSTRPSPGP